MQEFFVGAMSFAFGDVARYRDCRSAHLRNHPVLLIFWKAFCESVGAFGQCHRMLPHAKFLEIPAHSASTRMLAECRRMFSPTDVTESTRPSAISHRPAPLC